MIDIYAGPAITAIEAYLDSGHALSAEKRLQSAIKQGELSRYDDVVRGNSGLPQRICTGLLQAAVDKYSFSTSTSIGVETQNQAALRNLRRAINIAKDYNFSTQIADDLKGPLSCMLEHAANSAPIASPPIGYEDMNDKFKNIVELALGLKLDIPFDKNKVHTVYFGYGTAVDATEQLLRIRINNLCRYPGMDTVQLVCDVVQDLKIATDEVPFPTDRFNKGFESVQTSIFEVISCQPTLEARARIIKKFAGNFIEFDLNLAHKTIMRKAIDFADRALRRPDLEGDYNEGNNHLGTGYMRDATCFVCGRTGQHIIEWPRAAVKRAAATVLTPPPQ